MKRTWKFTLLTALTLTAAAPIAAAVPWAAVAHAAAPTISLDKTSAARGSDVTASGTYTPSAWVSLRVVDGAGQIVAFDAVRADGQGRYSFTFRLPSTAAGELKVYTGAGEEVASATVTVTTTSGGGDSTGGSSAAPPATTVAAPKAEGGVIAFAPKTETGADGRKQAVASVEASALRQALEQKPGKLIVRIDADEAEVVSVQLTDEALAAWLSQGTPAPLEFVTALGAYTLPADVVDANALAAALGVAANEVAIDVKIARATNAQSQAVERAADTAGAELVADTIDFVVEATAGGKKVPLSFGTTYVSRTLPISASVDPSKSTGARFDERTGKLVFVPSRIDEAKGTATLMRNGNSLYTVVASDKSFADVAAHWAKNDIDMLASKLVLNGVSADRFAPDATVTRAEFAAMIVRALGLDEQGDSTFSDVSSGAWYAGAVGAAFEAGLVSGYEDGTFRPDRLVTRQELAVLMRNAMAFADAEPASAASSLARYADRSDIADWAVEAVAATTASGITQGDATGAFSPADDATRAEAAAMLKRLLSHLRFID